MQGLPWKHVHFTGIGGVGMTGLALILDDFGVRVSGTDMVASTNTELLSSRGCAIHIGKIQLVVATFSRNWQISSHSGYPAPAPTAKPHVLPCCHTS